MIVPATINHTGPYDFLVDTGTQMTTIYPSLAAELQLKSQGEVRVLALGLPSRASFSRLELIEVGPLAMADHQVLVPKLDYSMGADVHIRGILGSNFLSRFDVFIDNAHQIICMDDTGAMQGAIKGRRIALVAPVQRGPASGSPGLLLLAVHLSGSESSSLLLKLDSASSVPFLYDPARYMYAGLSGGRLLQGENVDGTVRTFALLSPQEVRIGNMVLPRVEFATLLGAKHEVQKQEADGLLPTGLFRRVYIGYAGRFVILVP